jgi:uncharacterized protein YndB with AHSA1/START domain
MRTVSAGTLSFIEEAPVRVVEKVEVPASAARVFDALNDPEAVKVWWRGARGIVWQTPGPHGVGSVRTISPGPGLRLEETFIGWDLGRLWACTITAASLPLFAKYVIRVELEEPTPAATLVTWTSAVAPSRFGRLAGPIFPRIVRRTIRTGLAGLPGYFA